MHLLKKKILSGRFDFDEIAMAVFQYQARTNNVYKDFLSSLKIKPASVKSIEEIPFLPIGFFKTHDVVCQGLPIEKIFTSSGTTGIEPSRHLVSDVGFYRQVFLKIFELFYGEVNTYRFLALLPSYIERQGSSLVYMADELIKASQHNESGFYLYNLKQLSDRLFELERRNQQVLVLGVTYALLDLAEQFPLNLKHAIIMETGGMKGKRREMIRSEIHDHLQTAFNTKSIHSEYGMTELLSQAYSKGEGLFYGPEWMRVFIKEMNDPLGDNLLYKTGVINIIDLANMDSCAFIATSDIGKCYPDGSFEVLGRLDHSELRGCNLLFQN